ncbi:MAG: hypothetical protein JXB17_10505 [Bacteroidales bacterium]|nr:hypothetical protein [Bacteroidales bacterium]
MPDWLDNISIIKGHKCAGVHINILSANKYDISLLILNKLKTTLEIEKSINSLSSIHDIKEHINTSTPIILSIGGKGIIHKEAFKENGEINWLQIFPNTKKKDFYSQSFEITEKESLFSIIRKELVENILKEFKTLKLFVIDLFLGPVSVNQIISFINEDKINIPYYTIEINGKSIRKFKFTGQNESDISDYLIIENEKIRSDSLIPYTNSLSYFLGIDNVATDITHVAGERNEFINKQLLSKLFLVFLGLIFLILLVNYLLFDYYSNKKNEFAVKLAHNEELLNHLENLEKDLYIKEEIINNAGILSTTKWSYYTDRIALIVPNKIILTELIINSPLKKPEPGKEIIFIKNIFNISGKTSSSVYLNDWIKVLKQEDWISDVEIINFSQENKFSAGEFDIKILLKNTDN